MEIFFENMYDIFIDISINSFFMIQKEYLFYDTKRKSNAKFPRWI